MKNIVSLLITLSVLSSCVNGSGDLQFQVVKEEIVTQIRSDYVSYQTFKNLIFDKHCNTCHSLLNTEQALSIWIVPGSPEESKLYIYTENGSMPKWEPPLSSEELEIVRNYIISLGNPRVSFDQFKENVLEQKACLRCHSTMDNEEAISQWIDPNDPENSKLYLRVKDGSMPRRGTPLDKEEVKFVLDYIKTYLKK